MAEKKRCAAGDWVEVEWVLLEPSERAEGLPPETASKPLTVWVKGFARSEAALGDELTLETMTGRLVTGRLSDLEPGYFHTFGPAVPELTHVGADLRARLAEYRKAGGE
jgi:2-amino-4-ketopentanoate thiolase alpha subunit